MESEGGRLHESGGKSSGAELIQCIERAEM